MGGPSRRPLLGDSPSARAHSDTSKGLSLGPGRNGQSLTQFASKRGRRARGQLAASGERWTTEFIAGESRLEPEWRRASHLANKTLRLTPAEAEEVVARIEELLEPYGRSTRTDAPEDASLVRLLLRLFPRDLP